MKGFSLVSVFVFALAFALVFGGQSFAQSPTSKIKESFWEYNPRFTPKIERAIESQLNLRKQLRESGRYPLVYFAFDREDLKKLSQSDKEKALIYFITVNQRIYEGKLRVYLRAVLANQKAYHDWQNALVEMRRLK